MGTKNFKVYMGNSSGTGTVEKSTYPGGYILGTGTKKKYPFRSLTGSEYLEVAEANNIVMLFPQSTPFEGNEQGCWDIFGASNSETYGKFKS